VLGDVALPEQDASVRVEPGRDQDRHGVVDLPPQLGRVVRHGDRVQVDQAVDALPPLLALDVLTHPADQVAQVLAARRLDPGEDPDPAARARRRVAHDAADDSARGRPGREPSEAVDAGGEVAGTFANAFTMDSSGPDRMKKITRMNSTRYCSAFTNTSRGRGGRNGARSFAPSRPGTGISWNPNMNAFTISQANANVPSSPVTPTTLITRPPRNASTMFASRPAEHDQVHVAPRVLEERRVHGIGLA
jgi:hypothetical protein